MEHRLELRMLQKLILTPQLQQAIKLLQLPQLELSQTLNNELMENPLLEEVPEENPSSEETPAEEPETPETQERFEDPDDTEAPLERLMGYTVGDYFDKRSYDGRDLGYFTPDSAPEQSLEQYVSGGTDLYDHLNWQIRFSDAITKVKEAAEAVIGNIDENGFLQATDEDISDYAGCTLVEAAEAVKLVHTFDPAGVGARDLRECLLLQLGPLELEGTLVEQIIENDLDAVMKRRVDPLAQKYGCTAEEIREAVRVIGGLEPKPGRGLSGMQPIYIKPDVSIVNSEEGFQIVLNDDSVPHLRINSYYRKLLSRKQELQKEEKAYLEDKLRSAVWLLKSLDHRNKTIYRVAESILEFQREFFEHGVSRLKPLNLKDVAGELGMHESTISRTTSNKYLSCGHGLFSFKFFFSSAVSSNSGGGKVSSTAVKDVIRRLISEEDTAKPYSDQRIADMLGDLNIKVARRTVAKYREELNIPPQNLRKNPA